MRASAARAGVSGRKSTAKIRHISGRSEPRKEEGRARRRKGRKKNEGKVGRRARVVKGTRTNRHRFQWGKIERTCARVVLAGKGGKGIRAELKAGKTRSGYITACKCGEKD